MDVPLFNPTQVVPLGGGQVIPLGQIGTTTTNPRNATLWQISLALLCLFLAMQFIPHGVELGLLILCGTLLASPQVVDNLTAALAFVQHGG